MGNTKIIIGGITAVIIVIAVAIVVMAIASYMLAQLNNSDDDDGYECEWEDSESLSGLHTKLSWVISLSVIAVVLMILAVVGASIIWVMASQSKSDIKPKVL